jgi:hypothetical protein
MARLSFFKGAVTGKLGEFVGSKWKGINYLRLYAKPSNPRTEGQISIRAVFKAVSLFASALFQNGFLAFVPPARQMTERNSVFRANRQMFTDKTFVPEALQVATPKNLSFIGENIICKSSVSGGNKQFQMTGIISPTCDIKGVNLMVHLMVYDTNKGKSVFAYFRDCTISSTGLYHLNITANAPDDFDTELGSIRENCRLYLFLSGLDEKQKMSISKTVSVPVIMA